MAETSRPWSGTVTGDAGPYTDDDWTDVWFRFFGALADGDTGVLSNVLNELVVTGAATPLAVDTGFALVDGTFYSNSASVNVVIPTPAALVRIDRIVLRKSWAAQTIRITRIAGIEGGGVPALTQVDGVTWDLPLFQASVTVGGVITLTDERERLFTRSPSMTTAERDAMTAVNGMMIYNETENEQQFYENGSWGPAIPGDFQRIIASGNWTKPLGATHVLVVCIGGGGGGGGAEGRAAGQSRIGGDGGGGGAYGWKMLPASSLGALEAVTIGAGGAGGAGGTDANGATATVGGTTSFGSFLDAFGGGPGGGGGAVIRGAGGGGTGSAGTATAAGEPYYGSAPSGRSLGGGGAQGVDSAGAGVVGNPAEYGGGSGASSATDGTLGFDAGDSLYGGPGGGSGGGVTAGNAESTGGDGGDAGSYSTGGGGVGGAVDGGAGAAGAASADEKAGQGGGGGGSQDAGNGGTGGAGGAPAGGGGGGGGGTNTGGTGGAGGRGECRAWSW